METRNNEYGAPEIKQSYIKNFRRGLEFAIILHVVVVSAYMVISHFNSLNAEDIKQKPFEIKYVDIDIPPSVNDNDKPIDKPIEDIIKPIKDPGALIPDPVAKDRADQLTIKTQTELDKIIGNVSKDGDSLQYVYNGNGNDIKIDKQTDTKIDKNITKNDVSDKNFNGSEVDVLPECVNMEQVKSSLIYPKVAIEANIEGKVTLKVLVGTDGKVIKTGNINGPEVFYDQVTEKAKNLEFTPGLMSNKAVNVWVTVPFSFKLKN